MAMESMKQNKRFMSIVEACEYTGLSKKYLRAGCRDGSIPYILSGSKYLVNMPLLLERLDRESERTRRDDE